MLPVMENLYTETLAWLAQHPRTTAFSALAGLLFLAQAVHVVLRRFLVRLIEGVIRRTSFAWDDAIHESRVFERLMAVIPIVIILQGIDFLPELPESVLVLVERLAHSIAVVIGVRVIGAVLDAIDVIYRSSSAANQYAIKGYLQIFHIAVVIVGVILILAILMDRSPMIFLGGLGAMTAVLLLVFKDTILGFVASLQIASNDMVRVGDWIEMPAAGADGDVIEIALHTVKIQNWDKTISTIPTYHLIQESFKNWRGMSESGGRRIKRSLAFDVNTVRFLEPAEVEAFGRYALLHDYIGAKAAEIAEHNAQSGRDRAINADIRRLTNIGTLRAYIECYLKNHDQIHQGMTLLVRQLQPAGEGLPIEIYCFTSTTNWNAYEAIQADIFDHILAILPEFGLRVYQAESDFKLGFAAGDTVMPRGGRPGETR